MPGFSRVIGPLLRTPEQGVDTIVWLAAAARAAATSAAGSGATGAPRPTHRLARTRESRGRARSALAVRSTALAAGACRADMITGGKLTD